MARRLSWFDVRGGLIAVIAIVLISAAILKYSRLGTLHGDTMVLVAHVGEARGLLVGSEVWLSGQKIGKVLEINFRPPQTADTSARIELRMAVLEKYRQAIHRDAVAQIQAGGSVIGAPVVYFTPGTVRTGVIRPGDTVTTHPQADAERATGEFSVASREFPAIINNVKLLAGLLSTTRGSAGAFLNGPGGPGLPALPHTVALTGRLYATLNGYGTVGRVRAGGLAQHISASLARVDSVRALLDSPNTSFGRFRKDSTLLAEVGSIRDELSLVRAQLDDSRGTAGRALHDSAIGNAVIEAQRQMTLLFADVKKHPFRYIVF
ncbi:MAG: MlaD family protein [Gemmatimonadota bacterium]|nr:MlaD family protein [Gemmatimonadota bacterium]